MPKLMAVDAGALKAYVDATKQPPATPRPADLKNLVKASRKAKNKAVRKWP